MDTPIFFVFLMATFLAIAIIKLIHFLIRTSHRRLNDLLYFNVHSIVNSHNEQSRKAKKTQNVLSLISLFVFVFAVIALLVMLKQR